MALTGSPGPLPVEGTRTTPYQWLPAYVVGSTFSNLPASGLLFGGANLIASSTQQASNARGVLWFERGKGKLHINLPMMRGFSTVTDVIFPMEIAPGRDIIGGWVYSSWPILPGAAEPDLTHQPWTMERDKPSAFAENLMGNSISDPNKTLVVLTDRYNNATHYSGGYGMWSAVAWYCTTAYTGASSDFKGTGDFLAFLHLRERGWANAFLGASGPAVAVGMPLRYSFETNASGLRGGYAALKYRSFQGFAGQSVTTGASYVVPLYKIPLPDTFA